VVSNKDVKLVFFFHNRSSSLNNRILTDAQIAMHSCHLMADKISAVDVGDLAN